MGVPGFAVLRFAVGDGGWWVRIYERSGWDCIGLLEHGEIISANCLMTKAEHRTQPANCKPLNG